MTGTTPSTCTHLETTLGWRRTHTFESGLRKTVKWYPDHRCWWSSILAMKHDGGRLGLPTPDAKR